MGTKNRTRTNKEPEQKRAPLESGATVYCCVCVVLASDAVREYLVHEYVS